MFILAAAVIGLANLSYDETLPRIRGIPYRSYGWPLIWHRIVLYGPSWSPCAIGWYYNLPRLAANVATWIVVLTALAGTCEWLLRRYLSALCVLRVLCGYRLS